MPRFEPFIGVRYRSDLDPSQVTAPPYDVINPAERARLASQAFNAVHIDLPADGPSGDKYETARVTIAEWRTTGTLVDDSAPSFTVHRMTFTDETGRSFRTTGVLGALELWPPGAGQILPHEFITPKAASDRLDLLRSTKFNLSAIWGLTTAPITAMLPVDSTPTWEWTDPGQVTHSVWILSDPVLCGHISSTILDVPIVIADGHHRYETSLKYRDERRVSDGPGTLADSTLCYVVELVEEELTVLPTHRVIGDISAEDLHSALAQHFEIIPSDDFDGEIIDRLVEQDCLGLFSAQGSYLLRSKSDAFGESTLDTERVEESRRTWPNHSITYQHGWDQASAPVISGQAAATILVRPVTIDEIRAVAKGGKRMPPKTTFFSPKPSTGIVFRPLS